MFGLYITHPQVRIDPQVPVPQWGLSERGRQRCFKAMRQDWVMRLGRIVTSDETKAIETAEIFGRACGVRPEIVAGMHENDRSATGFLPPEAFEAAADQFFTHPNESFRGWETAEAAQMRIVRAVQGVLEHHDPALPLAFIGHGGVGTLLKCALLGRPISRLEDQPAGGGNLFAFALADLRPACDWTPIEKAGLLLFA
ncbi:histidine phosphatase family protein [Rhizobium paknamense]|uniref:Broad specificity phosphatase PhoE n=1 Tax=Rhizobium paknamense TaxID=1206817 RepID=A0ABU0IDN6_9HYPH|nr:histidine phosphatase family protein [Rhizobium paknamense]MDQ0455361.1 broad specificity phosphatase PhoE [Rhizobium paknamense]